MFIFNVKVSVKCFVEMMQKIVSILLDFIFCILGKDLKVMVIVIDYVDLEDWIVGGQMLVV